MKKVVCVFLCLAMLLCAACTEVPAAGSSAPTTENSESLHNGVDISKHRELTVATFSGSYEDIQKENLANSNFEEEYNCTVVFVESEGVQTMERVRNKEVDVLFTDCIYSFQGEAQNLYAPLNADVVPNLAECYDTSILSDYTILHDIGAYGIAYNPKSVTQVPQHWTDLWENEEYAGKIMLRPFRADSIELMVYMAKLNGGDERNIDSGFAKMAEIAPKVHTWSTSHATTLELFRSGDVAVGMWTDGRVAWAKKQGVEDIDFILPEEGGFLLTTTINVCAGSDNLDLAYAYVNMEMSKESQAVHSEALGYFPMNEEAYALLSDNAKSMMAFTPEVFKAGYNMCDWSYVVTVYDDWSEKWEKEVMGAAQ